MRKASSTLVTGDPEETDKIKLRMAMTKWWFKGKLITIKRNDKIEREALIEQVENDLHKQEIYQMAEIQNTIMDLR